MFKAQPVKVVATFALTVTLLLSALIVLPLWVHGRASAILTANGIVAIVLALLASIAFWFGLGFSHCKPKGYYSANAAIFPCILANGLVIIFSLQQYSLPIYFALLGLLPLAFGLRPPLHAAVNKPVKATLTDRDDKPAPGAAP
jgi:hypothetical protein